MQDGAQYVLANWQAGDVIGFNDWQGQYYFRNVADHWYDAADSSKEPPKRIWYLATSMDDAVRERKLNQMPADWHIVDRREFKFAIVALFVPKEDGLSSNSGVGFSP